MNDWFFANQRINSADFPAYTNNILIRKLLAMRRNSFWNEIREFSFG